MTAKKDDIKVGGMFNAYVKKGEFSKTLGGEEGTGNLAHFCPERAISVNELHIESETSIYKRAMFTFDKAL